MNNTEAIIKSSYDAKLTNQDLAPLKSKLGALIIFLPSGCRMFIASAVMSWLEAFLHSGSIAGRYFYLYSSALQLFSFTNLIAKSSQQTGTPYPVICRATFGVLGANIPAVIRGLIAVAWYGIQTYLASSAFLLVILKFFPDWSAYADVSTYGFLGFPI